MINIMICDDQPVFLDIITEQVKKAMISITKKYTVFTFRSGQDFINFINEGNTIPHIVFMDMEMPEINDRHAAKVLKSMYPESQLLFVTCYENEIDSAFDYNANGFISKYMLNEKIQPNLIRVINNIHLTNHTSDIFKIYGESGKTEQIPLEYSEIIYIEYSMGKAYAVMTDGNIHHMKCGRWHELVAKYSKHPFSSPQQNYIVNMSHIERITDDGITLKTSDKKISISRRKRNAFMKDYSEFIISGAGI